MKTKWTEHELAEGCHLPKDWGKLPNNAEMQDVYAQLTDLKRKNERLVEACQEALECVLEWRDADLVLHTEKLQAQLESAICDCQ